MLPPRRIRPRKSAHLPSWPYSRFMAEFPCAVLRSGGAVSEEINLQLIIEKPRLFIEISRYFQKFAFRFDFSRATPPYPTPNLAATGGRVRMRPDEAQARLMKVEPDEEVFTLFPPGSGLRPQKESSRRSMNGISRPPAAFSGGASLRVGLVEKAIIARNSPLPHPE